MDQSVLWFTGDHCEQAEAIVMGTKNDTSKTLSREKGAPTNIIVEGKHSVTVSGALCPPRATFQGRRNDMTTHTIALIAALY